MIRKADATKMVSSYLDTILSVISEYNLLLAKNKKNDNDIEFINFENTLCTAWDMATVSKYAYAMQVKYQISKYLTKIISSKRRPRARELSLGILANLACHENIKQILLYDSSILLLCQSLLCVKQQSGVLLETARLLNSLFIDATPFFSTCSTFVSKKKDRQQFSKMSSFYKDNNHLHLFLISNDILRYSIYHQYTQAIMDTLDSELLLAGLQLLTSFTFCIHGFELSWPLLPSSLSLSSLLSSPPLPPTSVYYIGDNNKEMRREKLINWAIEHLNKETKDIGSEVKLNSAKVKSILCLVWTFLFYGLLSNPSQCISNLNSSLSIITKHLQQQTESDKTSDDQDIEIIVNSFYSMKMRLFYF